MVDIYRQQNKAQLLVTYVLNSYSTTTQMAVELDIFVGNTTIMDEEVYQLWLDGYTGRAVTLV